MFYLPESVPLNLSSAQGAFFFSTTRLVLLAFKISWLLSLCDKEQLCFYLWWLLLLKWEYKKTTRACWWPGELCQTAKLQGMMPNMRLMNCSAGLLKNNYPFNVKLKLTILRAKSWKNNTSFFFYSGFRLLLGLPHAWRCWSQSQSKIVFSLSGLIWLQRTCSGPHNLCQIDLS